MNRKSRNTSHGTIGPALFILVAGLVVTLATGSTLSQQRPSTANPKVALDTSKGRIAELPTKFTVKKGQSRIEIKQTSTGDFVGLERNTGRIFKFKHLKRAERPTIKGREGQALKCMRLFPGGDARWTLCAFVGGNETQAAAHDFLLEIEGIRGESWDDDGPGGGGGGGGGGTPSNCWEDEELQMSICDP